MENLYTNGDYLEATRTWHAEDAPWKAEQIKKIIDRNKILPKSIAEIGCGSGSILNELSKSSSLRGTRFEGYDISPQAIDMAARLHNGRLKFCQRDLISEDETTYFDVLLVIDVFEHVPDYMGFVASCRKKAAYKIFHIPLDVHVSSVLRNSFTRNRYTIGHIHYFTADSALSTLRDTGHEVLDFLYTDGAIGLFMKHPTLKKALANLPRWLLSKFSVPLTARLLGGYSLLVLTR